MPTNRTKRTRDRTGAGGLTEGALSWFWWGRDDSEPMGRGEDPGGNPRLLEEAPAGNPGLVH